MPVLIQPLNLERLQPAVSWLSLRKLDTISACLGIFLVPPSAFTRLSIFFHDTKTQGSFIMLIGMSIPGRYSAIPTTPHHNGVPAPHPGPFPFARTSARIVNSYDMGPLFDVAS